MPDLVDEVEVELMNETDVLPAPRRSMSPGKKSTESLQRHQLGVGRPSSSKVQGRTGSNGSSRVASGSSNASHSSQRREKRLSTQPTSQASSPVDNPGPHPWTKDDWKNLERCFIQERKVVAQRLGLASSKDVSPNHVDVQLVLERFKGFLVLSKQLKTGPEWDR